MKELLKKNFPDLIEPGLIAEIEKQSAIKKMVPGDLMMDVGQYIKFVPLLLTGKLKVFREDDDGNELFLYYITPGETCAVSLVCSSNDRKSKIKAVCVEEAELITVPIRFMDEWVQHYRSWYYFVLNAYRKRFEDLLFTLDSVAFHKMDDRLLNYLEKHVAVNQSETINITHQDIANELNTSREVISRLLKQLERKGVLKLGRNQIEMLN